MSPVFVHEERRESERGGAVVERRYSEIERMRSEVERKVSKVKKRSFKVELVLPGRKEEL